MPSGRIGSVRSAFSLAALIVSIMVVSSAAVANTVKVVPPSGASPNGLVSELGYVYAGTLGVATALNPGNSLQLFSFSTASGQIADTADLTADFGAMAPDSTSYPFESVLTYDISGLIAVYGQDS